MKTETDAQNCEDFPVHTSQEMDAINRARANGKSFNGYSGDEQAGSVFYMHAALAHRVELVLTSTERAAGLGIEHLEKIVRAQDADGLIAQLYIMGVLAPMQLRDGLARGVGWIDFDDVIAKIGWTPRSTQQRREMHAKLWEFIQFGERAVVIGERSTPYINPSDKSKINTRVESAVWRVHDVRKVEQGELPFSDEVPVAAQIIISPRILELLTSPMTAQFLPMGEVLGAIPGGNAGGAWARVIGLALASFWRRHPQKSLSGEYRPTRRELLTHYPPKVAPLDEILTAKNSVRAIEYWCDALALLCDTGILARESEATRTYDEIRNAVSPRDWHDEFLDERVVLFPGEEMCAHIQGRATAIEKRQPTSKKPKQFRARKSA